MIEIAMKVYSAERTWYRVFIDSLHDYSGWADSPKKALKRITKIVRSV